MPNVASAFVADAKVRDYLLDPAHPNNGGKAGSFRRFGFTQQHWPDLENGLRFHPQANPVAIVTRNPYGIRYTVRCSLSSPDGRNPCITTIWFTDPSSNRPTLSPRIRSIPAPTSGRSATIISRNPYRDLPAGGLEPPRQLAADFKSAASTVPPGGRGTICFYISVVYYAPSCRRNR
jgi:hypothetical protein